MKKLIKKLLEKYPTCRFEIFDNEIIFGDSEDDWNTFDEVYLKCDLDEFKHYGECLLILPKDIRCVFAKEDWHTEDEFTFTDIEGNNLMVYGGIGCKDMFDFISELEVYFYIDTDSYPYRKFKAAYEKAVEEKEYNKLYEEAMEVLKKVCQEMNFVSMSSENLSAYGDLCFGSLTYIGKRHVYNIVYKPKWLINVKLSSDFHSEFLEDDYIEFYKSLEVKADFLIKDFILQHVVDGDKNYKSAYGWLKDYAAKYKTNFEICGSDCVRLRYEDVRWTFSLSEFETLYNQILGFDDMVRILEKYIGSQRVK